MSSKEQIEKLEKQREEGNNKMKLCVAMLSTIPT